MDYKARFYDPLLGRFIQSDTLIPSPSSSQALNRYAYVNNNPVNFNDPTGNMACWDDNRNDPHCKGLYSTANGLVDAKTYSLSLAKGLYAENRTSILYWDGLDPATQKILSEGGFDRGSYNDGLKAGVVPVDPLHDPAVWVSVLVGLGSPFIKQAIIIGLTKLFTHNAESMNVSLGNYMKSFGYTSVGEYYNMTYLEAPTSVYKLLTKMGMWNSINETFITNQINQGKTFFVTQIGQISPGTQAEIEQIILSGQYNNILSTLSRFINIFSPK